MTVTFDNLQQAGGGIRSPSYGITAKLLHWLVFALVLAQVMIGWLMPDIDRNTPQEGLVGWHLSVGAVLLAVIIFRLGWRISHPVAPVPSLREWERRLSTAVHTLLYALLTAIPLLGWAAAGYYGYTVRLFGVIRLPALAARSAEWAHTAGDVHAVLVNVLLAALAVHVAGALYHFLRGDRVLQRMLP